MSDTVSGGDPGTGLVDLSGLRVFVGGPIQYALGHNSFHRPLRETLQTIVTAVAEAGATVFSAHVVEKFGLETPLYSPEDVSARDLEWMRRCDVFVPVLPTDADGGLMRTDGTHIELGWASALGRPIVMVTALPVPAAASHLLRGLPSVADVGHVDLAELRRGGPGELLLRLGKVGRDAVVTP
ncbi:MULTISPECIES: nucleoside 2-deoxyribosyltransferase [unclassified Streptomyces]|uniref:nucleoside 2-deoxyribosyltransferase n=1 Tax=unclassified Streptomyces TaxID=2593676 RepID=UPI0033FD0FAA